ncbi:MAG: fumarylacetoacetate hydrolase family protein [Polaromonas sp.]|uniref:fumarylacetoacetate hydrolase family protein n=1 Tax=Polaromonas sp. TaxID=1869339 RepID=UPI0025CBA22C|nr:fumarylacetoacetate hydrolase family protein [Polaromonas sp.]MBI2726257.1 fumarylacetoacetate hydrolase family protein [Polaromonas sp.]
MKLVSFIVQETTGKRASYGAVIGNRVIDLATPEASSLRQALAAGGVPSLEQRLMANSHHGGLPLDGLTLLPPIPDPNKILCVGLNYFLHAQEVNMPVPSNPSVFVRYPNSIVGQNEPILRPPESEQFDYEAEMAIIIGKRGRRISEETAMQHVAGYCCMAENSIRDWQRHSAQATPGKNFYRSGALGPWIVTPDEIGDLRQLEIVGRLNGEVMQHDSIAQLIFPVPRLIAYLSTFTELEAGDVIATGTPAGVGMSRKPQRWLRSGDVFEVEITGLGVLRNPVVDETIPQEF